MSIIGLGEDGTDGLSPTASLLIANAELVVGGARHLQLAGELISGRRLAWPRPLTDALATIESYRGRQVAIIASGDPFHFGIGKLIAERFGHDAFVCLPQASAFSLAAARLGWALQDVAMITLHGRPLEGLMRHLQPGARILALSWDGHTPAKVARLLADNGMGASQMVVLEAMGGPRERVRGTTAGAFDCPEIDPLNTLAITVEGDGDHRFLPLTPGLDDLAFEHDGQLTKRDIRVLTLSALAPRRGQLLWDIGTGAGSIAIEWLLRDTSLRAIGIERDPARAARAARNAVGLGTPELRVVTGAAPEALRDLPQPDAIFIGGGLMSGGVFEAAWSALAPGGRLVANAVTVDSEAYLATLFARHSGELVRHAVSRAEPVGSRRGWRPAMPVTQWRMTKS